jgi:GNAT superfamily N-acetyltransferase
MRDAPRRVARSYRKEEWVAYGDKPQEVDASARQQSRGHYVISAMRQIDESDDAMRSEYKRLGYRLQSTEPLFVHRLKRIPRTRSPARICRLKSAKLAAELGNATRSKPLSDEFFANDAPFRQYVALDSAQIVGWVRSVRVLDARWCSHMEVIKTHRRQGIGSALLGNMLRDDRANAARQSVLLASHAGALLYPRIGYEQIGLLLLFVPSKR